MGKIFVITGPSGSGKTTIIKEFFRIHSPSKTNLFFSISYTSRPQRPNEIHGVDYFFVTTEVFQQMIKQHKFLEYVLFDSHYYGTSFPYIEKSLKNNRNVLLDIDIIGALKIREIYPRHSYLICISAVREAIEQRLHDRQNNSKRSIAGRMKLFDNDYSNLKEEMFEVIIINKQNNLSSVSQDLIAFLVKSGIHF